MMRNRLMVMFAMISLFSTMLITSVAPVQAIDTFGNYAKNGVVCTANRYVNWFFQPGNACDGNYATAWSSGGTQVVPGDWLNLDAHINVPIDSAGRAINELDTIVLRDNEGGPGSYGRVQLYTYSGDYGTSSCTALEYTYSGIPMPYGNAFVPTIVNIVSPETNATFVCDIRITYTTVATASTSIGLSEVELYGPGGYALAYPTSSPTSAPTSTSSSSPFPTVTPTATPSAPSPGSLVFDHYPYSSTTGNSNIVSPTWDLPAHSVVTVTVTTGTSSAGITGLTLVCTDGFVGGWYATWYTWTFVGNPTLVSHTGCTLNIFASGSYTPGLTGAGTYSWAIESTPTPTPGPSFSPFPSVSPEPSQTATPSGSFVFAHYAGTSTTGNTNIISPIWASMAVGTIPTGVITTLFSRSGSLFFFCTGYSTAFQLGTVGTKTFAALPANETNCGFAVYTDGAYHSDLTGAGTYSFTQPLQGPGVTPGPTASCGSSGCEPTTITAPPVCITHGPLSNRTDKPFICLVATSTCVASGGFLDQLGVIACLIGNLPAYLINIPLSLVNFLIDLAFPGSNELPNMINAFLNTNSTHPPMVWIATLNTQLTTYLPTGLGTSCTLPAIPFSITIEGATLAADPGVALHEACTLLDASYPIIGLDGVSITPRQLIADVFILGIGWRILLFALTIIGYKSTGKGIDDPEAGDTP